MLETAEQNATSAPVKSDMAPAKPIRLLDQVRNRICVKHYSRSTEKTYIYWIKNNAKCNKLLNIFTNISHSV